MSYVYRLLNLFGLRHLVSIKILSLFHVTFGQFKVVPFCNGYFADYDVIYIGR